MWGTTKKRKETCNLCLPINQHLWRQIHWLLKTNWYTFLSRYTSNGVWVYLGKVLPKQAIGSYFWSALKWLNKSLGSHFSRPPFQTSRLLLEAMWKQWSQKWLPKLLQTHGLCSLLFYKKGHKTCDHPYRSQLKLQWVHHTWAFFQEQTYYQNPVPCFQFNQRVGNPLQET